MIKVTGYGGGNSDWKGNGHNNWEGDGRGHQLTFGEGVRNGDGFACLGVGSGGESPYVTHLIINQDPVTMAYQAVTMQTHREYHA